MRVRDVLPFLAFTLINGIHCTLSRVGHSTSVNNEIIGQLFGFSGFQSGPYSPSYETSEQNTPKNRPYYKNGYLDRRRGRGRRNTPLSVNSVLVVVQLRIWVSLGIFLLIGRSFIGGGGRFVGRFLNVRSVAGGVIGDGQIVNTDLGATTFIAGSAQSPTSCSLHKCKRRGLHFTFGRFVGDGGGAVIAVLTRSFGGDGGGAVIAVLTRSFVVNAEGECFWGDITGGAAVAYFRGCILRKLTLIFAQRPCEKITYRKCINTNSVPRNGLYETILEYKTRIKCISTQ